MGGVTDAIPCLSPIWLVWKCLVVSVLTNRILLDLHSGFNVQLEWSLPALCFRNISSTFCCCLAKASILVLFFSPCSCSRQDYCEPLHVKYLLSGHWLDFTNFKVQKFNFRLKMWNSVKHRWNKFNGYSWQCIIFCYCQQPPQKDYLAFISPVSQTLYHLNIGSDLRGFYKKDSQGYSFFFLIKEKAH